MNSELTVTEGICPVCDSGNISVVLEIFQVPIHCNVLWPTRDEALRVPRADMRLGFCGACGHIYNFAFNPHNVDYTQDYENSLHFSPRFQDYARLLAARLIERHNLYDKNIIEIGCGRGDFLKLLCELGENCGVGFDPSHEDERTTTADAGRVEFIHDFYSERCASYKADLICCRHVLEHIQFPRDFLITVRRAIGSRLGTIVFFEVPNVMFTLKDLGIWDLIYEHPSYFSIASFARAFTSSGFRVHYLTEAFEGQFLCIEALPVEGSANSGHDYRDDLERMAYEVTVFAGRYRSKVDTWRRELERIQYPGKRAVVWGGGSKGVTFLNTLKVQDQIKYVVDINPHKHGMYVAGTGQRIVSPEFLKEYRPDIVIVMNPIYLQEIQRLLKQLNLYSEVISV